MQLNTLSYLNAAKLLRMEVVVNQLTDGFILKLGNANYYFYDRETPFNNGSSILIASNKYLTNRLLNAAQIPVANAQMIEARDYSLDLLIEKTKTLKFPLVVKPLSWSKPGSDVTCNIPDIKILHMQCLELLNEYPALALEEYHRNLKDYRVLVFKNKIIGVAARYPAFVIGNGKDTIAQLVASKNKKRAQESKHLNPIVFDFESSLCLSNQNVTTSSIPAQGEKISISYTCNVSRGGEFETIPVSMCKENRMLIIKAAKILNLEFVGFDIACKSLDEPIANNGGIIIEANYNPSVIIHRTGIEGRRKNVSLTIMRSFIFKHPFSYLFYLFLKTKLGISILFLLLFLLALLIVPYMGIIFSYL